MIPHKPFYFLRHGETDLNKVGLIMGSVDDPLNTHGLEQAKEAGLLLKAVNFDVVISSPRLRALQTAEQIRGDRPLYVEPNLTERVWGEAEGIHFNFINFNDTPVGGEAAADFRKRILTSISIHLENNKTVLFVSHGGIFKTLCQALGHPNLTSFNAVPYLFRPPEHPTHPWFICDLGEV